MLFRHNQKESMSSSNTAKITITHNISLSACVAKLLLCSKLSLYTFVTIEVIHYVLLFLNVVAKPKCLERGQNYIYHYVIPDKDISNPVRLKNCLFGSECNAI